MELGAFSARDCTLVVSTSDSRGDLNYYLVTIIIYVMDWVVIESGVLIGPLLSSITSNSIHTQV